MTSFFPPRHIDRGDRTAQFDCGELALNNWLKNFALRNEKSNASRTFVSVTEENEVAGFYCLASSSLKRDGAPPAVGAGMPDPIPVVIIGRLAVDLRFEKQGLGFSLLQDAVLRSIDAADSVGFRAILVYALNAGVVGFYEKFGFSQFPDQSNTLYLLTADAVATLNS